jgi:hypothetical protein
MVAFSRVTTCICFVACLAAPAKADGALDFADYCKAIEKDQTAVSASIERDVSAITTKLANWYKDPTTIPPDDLEHYRNVVQLAAYKAWEQSASGAELIKAWKTTDPNVNVVDDFNKKIYSKEMTPEKEIEMARRLYKIDYEQNIKPKLDQSVATINKNIADSKQKVDESCKPDVVSQIFRGTIGRLLLIYAGNKEAAKNEKGDIAALTRLLTGISLTDITKYGIGGGPNSELKKLGKTWTDGLDSIGIGPNSFLRQGAAALDPTNLNVPKQLQITIDDRSLPNLEKNLNPFRWKW